MRRAQLSCQWGLSVRAVIRDRAGRILLLRRHPRANSFGGTWELPGGKVNARESFDVGLLREVREETGLEVALKALVGASETSLRNRRIVTLFFRAEARAADCVQLSGEHDDFCWAPPARISRVSLNPQVRGFLKQHVRSLWGRPARDLPASARRKS
jgi:8-oxo-dGTP diphosphatase